MSNEEKYIFTSGQSKLVVKATETVTMSLSRYENLKESIKDFGKEAQSLRKEVFDLKQDVKVLKEALLKSHVYDVTYSTPKEPVRYVYGAKASLNALGITDAEMEAYLSEYVSHKASEKDNQVS